ncbi:hypothetical protein ACFY1L_31765 [Streptomyces sp. NPDC001663]|uniref:hypothetical protein n=1 Tax=Streptomyces sp. NPDC001663 TaxID=3364597 RepID=UPI0036859538
MISTRRIVTAVGLAAGLTGLVAPLAHADEAAVANAAVPGTDLLNPITTVDALSATAVPVERKAPEATRETKETKPQAPRPEQVEQLRSIRDLKQLHRVADMQANWAAWGR